MTRIRPELRGSLFVVAAVTLSTGAARADVPPGYQGKPFDPALAKGSGIYPAGFNISSAPAAKAGPYAIPGRLDLVNFDLGGEGVAFHAGDHIATKAGGGYRNDNPSPSLGLTGWDTATTLRQDVWYMAGAALDGTVYPTPTTHELYIGAVQVNDWFDYTVDVSTAGIYALSSTWSTGNGPPGGEGGDGAVGLQVYANGTKLGEWHDTFPSYQTTADYQHWKPYPQFLTITLAAGLQVLKIQSTTKHLHLGYIQFDLVGADGGVGTPADAGAAGSAGAAGAADAGSAGSGGSSGTAGATGGGAGDNGAAGVSGAGGAAGVSGAAGSSGAAGAAGAGTAGASSTGAAGGAGHATTGSGGCGCALSASGHSLGRGGLVGLAALLVAWLLARARRRRA